MPKKSRAQPMLFGFEDLVEDSNTNYQPNLSNNSIQIATSEDSVPPPTPTRVAKAENRSLQPGDSVLVVDSHSFIYQLFHAMPPMTNSHGQAIGTLFGFLRDIADIRDQYQPDFLLCAFDVSGETFRNELYPAYKEHRDPMPDDLRSQIPLIQEGLTALGVPILTAAGFEADDILATVAKHVETLGGKCMLLTSDKDCRQLLSESVSLLNFRKKEFFGPKQLLETWGIRPEQVVDYQALVGDSSDNVPGVPQIGPKAAAELLLKYGSLETILGQASQMPPSKKTENLTLFRDQAILSQELVRLRTDVPIELNWEQWSNQTVATIDLFEFFNANGLKKLGERYQLPSDLRLQRKHVDRSQYQCITTQGQLHDLIRQLNGVSLLSLDTETTSTQVRDCEPVGYSFAWAPGQAAYLPLKAPRGEPVLDRIEVNKLLKPILESPKVLKIGQNLKFDINVFRSQSIELQGIAFDTMVADYLLDAGERNHGLGDIAKRWLGVSSISITDLIGSGKNQRTMDQVPLELITEYACEDVDLPIQLYEILRPRLEQEGLLELFNNLEMPLIEVLAEMEFNGIQISREKLLELSYLFEKKIDELLLIIRDLAGQELNPDSPKQLAKVLFEDLHLPVIKKTKTGPSTDVEVLQELASKHPLPATLIEYRQATKLKGTYIDALPLLISKNSQRVHTSFRQDVAATGRLSSSDPNLQNIPIRTEEGRRIRSAFEPGIAGWKLLAADYSQIELRVLAHFCGDASLCKAFENKLDIHAMVASEVYGVPLPEVSSSMRRNAKAINFGIIYGQSPYGLAKSLSISKDEASTFIDSYFARYPGVLQFISDTLGGCRRDGFVTTMAGRKRWIKGVRDFQSLDAKRRKGSYRTRTNRSQFGHSRLRCRHDQTGDD